MSFHPRRLAAIGSAALCLLLSQISIADVNYPFANPGLHEVMLTFGERFKHADQSLRLHDGLDISAAAGTSVLAPSGQFYVLWVQKSGYESYIFLATIDEDYDVLYAHIDEESLSLVQGDVVGVPNPVDPDTYEIAELGDYGTMQGEYVNHLHIAVQEQFFLNTLDPLGALDSEIVDSTKPTITSKDDMTYTYEGCEVHIGFVGDDKVTSGGPENTEAAFYKLEVWHPLGSPDGYVVVDSISRRVPFGMLGPATGSDFEGTGVNLDCTAPSWTFSPTSHNCLHRLTWDHDEVSPPDTSEFKFRITVRDAAGNEEVVTHSPSPIEYLVHFACEVVGGYPTIGWVSNHHEDELQGYVLWRSSESVPEERLVTGLMPPSESGGPDEYAYEYVDRSAPAEMLNYTLGLVRDAGDTLRFGPVSLDATDLIDWALALHGASPNPVSMGSSLQFELPESEEVVLELYSVDGRLVRRLFDGPAGPGRTSVYWDGKDDDRRPVASGVYFCVLKAESGVRTPKLSLVR